MSKAEMIVLAGIVGAFALFIVGLAISPRVADSGRCIGSPTPPARRRRLP
jgi:hypothetical protein